MFELARIGLCGSETRTTNSANTPSPQRTQLNAGRGVAERALGCSCASYLGQSFITAPVHPLRAPRLPYVPRFVQ